MMKKEFDIFKENSLSKMNNDNKEMSKLQNYVKNLEE